MIRIGYGDRELVIEGHSGFGDLGEDIVCAAVSGMSQMAAYALKRLGGDFEKRKGYLRISWIDDDCSRLIVETFIEALKAIERDYPGHLKVEVM